MPQKLEKIDTNAFKDFVDLFLADKTDEQIKLETAEIQPAILGTIREFLKNDPYCSGRGGSQDDKFIWFYETVEETTGIFYESSNFKKTDWKSKKGGCNGSVNTQLKRGTCPLPFAFVIYFWFHTFNDSAFQKVWAKRIDKVILANKKISEQTKERLDVFRTPDFVALINKTDSFLNSPLKGEGEKALAINIIYILYKEWLILDFNEINKFLKQKTKDDLDKAIIELNTNNKISLQDCLKQVDVLKQINSTTTIVNNFNHNTKQKPLNYHEDYHLCNWKERCSENGTYDLLIVAGNGRKEIKPTDGYLPIPTVKHLQQLLPQNSNLSIPQDIADLLEKAHNTYSLLQASENPEDRVRAGSMEPLPVQSFVPIQEAHSIVTSLYSSLLAKSENNSLLNLPPWEALPNVKIGNSIDCSRLKTFTGYDNYHLDPQMPEGAYDLRKHNLLLLGGGDTNLITRLVLGIYQQPTIHFEHNGDSEILNYTIDNKLQIPFKQSYCPDTKLGILFMQPNPFNEDKVVIIAAGLGRYGTQAAMSALANPIKLEGVNRHIVAIDNREKDNDSHYYEVLV